MPPGGETGNDSSFEWANMRLEATAEGTTHTVEIDEGDEKGLVRVKVAEREYLVDMTTPVPGLYSLLVEGKVVTAYVSPKRGRQEVQVGHWSTGVEVVQPQRRGPSPKAAAVASGRQEITAPMSGRVVQVLVDNNAVVQEGAGLVIVEAMKMETEIRSPIAGHVKEVRVQAGMTVETGQLLLVVES